MNLYFLVEGKRTEKKVYPSWLGHLVPELAQVKDFEQTTVNNYFIFSGEGYPSLLYTHLPNAVADINSVARYDYLVVCLDADEVSVVERKLEVELAMKKAGVKLNHCQLKVIVQNRCIETWFLGNRKIVSRTPQNRRLIEFLRFYNVIDNDPELMGIHPSFSLHSPFHSAFLREVFQERGISYSKNNPQHVCDQSYLEQLIARIDGVSDTMLTFSDFVTFCREIRSSLHRNI